MKKYILVLTIVTSLALEAVPPHFHTDNPRFREYKPSNPYKYYEVEIRPWRSLPKEKVELVLNKFNFPLIVETKPYIEKNLHGRCLYVKKIFKPELRLEGKPTPILNERGEETGTYKNNIIKYPYYYKGKRVLKLVIVYEKVNKKGMPSTKKGEWICYDAYWETER